jgi:membrane associated rhomboid family serine protease
MFADLTPTVRALLIANLGVYALQAFLGPDLMAPFELWPLRSAVLGGGLPFEPWQLVSYGFVHLEFWHLFANMFALYMFGPDVERLLGAARFRVFYLVCVVGAAGAQLLVTATIHPSPYPTLGASGGVFGLLLAYGMAYPHRRLLLLFPPIPMPAWLFVTLYGVMELLLGIFATNQGVAHFAHLGGMAAGYALIRYWRRRG